MSQLTPADNLKLESLQDLCEECMKAYNEQDDMVLKATMKDVCNSCAAVRNHLPELMALRRKVEAFNQKLSTAH